MHVTMTHRLMLPCIKLMLTFSASFTDMCTSFYQTFELPLVGLAVTVLLEWLLQLTDFGRLGSDCLAGLVAAVD